MMQRSTFPSRPASAPLRRRMVPAVALAVAVAWLCPLAALADDSAPAATLPYERFNQALVHAQAGELGLGVAELERAQLQAPLDTGIYDLRQALLAEARRLHADRVPGRQFTAGEPPSIQRWRLFRSVPLDAVGWVLVAASWIAFGALIARRFARDVARDLLAVGAGISLVVGSLAGAWIAGHAWTSRTVLPLVVVANDPVCRDAPDELARTRTHPDLYAGAIGVQRGERDRWRQVELPGGDLVWVDQSAVSAITP